MVQHFDSPDTLDDIDRVAARLVRDMPPAPPVFRDTLAQLRAEHATPAPLSGGFTQNSVPLLPVVGDDEGAMTPTPIAIATKRRNRVPLALVAGLTMTIIAAAVAVLLVGHTNPQNTVIGAATVSTTSAKLDINLVYPGSTNVLDKQPFAKSVTIFYGLATTDEYQTVGNYYLSTLRAAGFTINGDPTPAQGQIFLSGLRSNWVISGVVFNPAAWQARRTAYLATPSTTGARGVLQASFLNTTSKLAANQTYIDIYATPLTPAQYQTQLNSMTGAVPSGSTQAIVAPPTPAPLASPTPVSPTSQAYLGPDGQLHADGSAALVSTAPSADVATNRNGATFRVEWLVSDATATYLYGTLTGKGLPTGIAYPQNQPVAQLTDGQGHTYSLSYSQHVVLATAQHAQPTHTEPSQMLGGPSTQTVPALQLEGPPLAPGIHSLTLLPTSGFPFTLNGPVTIPVGRFADAKLPQAVTSPGATATNRGITVRVPYAAFLPDKTILQVAVDTSGYAGGAQIGVGSISVGIQALDANGKPLTPQQPATLTIQMDTNPQTVTVGPISPDAKSLLLTVTGITYGAHYTPAPTFSVPVAGKPQDGGTFTVSGVPVQITGESATLDTTQSKATLNLTMQAQPTDTGVQLTDLTLRCVTCATSDSGGGESGYGRITRQFTFAYDPAQPAAQFAVDEAYFTLTGTWNLTLPVPAH